MQDAARTAIKLLSEPPRIVHDQSSGVAVSGSLQRRLERCSRDGWCDLTVCDAASRTAPASVHAAAAKRALRVRESERCTKSYMQKTHKKTLAKCKSERKRGAEAPLSWTNSHVRTDPQRKLQLPRIRSAILAGSIADRSVSSAGRAETDVIEDIECIHAELNRSSLMDREALHHRQIGIEEVRPIEAISSQSSDLVQSGRREVCRHGRRIKVAEGSVRGAGDLVLEPRPVSIHVAGSRARNPRTSAKG